MQKITVSIIIVYFDGWENLESSLQSILQQKTVYLYEIFVVNNGKEDIRKKIAQVSTKIRYVKSPRNLGYGAGNNLGVSKAKGEYYFILNPDTKLAANTVQVLSDYLKKNPTVGIVGPNLLHEDQIPFTLMGTKDLTPLTGIVAHSFLNKLFPKNPISRIYYMLDIPKTQVREVGTVPGSACMIRANVFQKVGGYDEHMFLYYEESDLGKRVRDAGYKLIITPKTQVVHKHSTHNNKALKKYNLESRFYYFKKHYGLLWALLVEVFCRFSKWHAFGVCLLIIFICLFTLAV